MSFEGRVGRDTAVSILAHRRSALLDAFADLELEIRCCARRVGAESPSRGTPLAQRVKRLAQAEPSALLSKTDEGRLKELTGQCTALLPMRAALVHSRMRICADIAPAVAVFRNAADVADGQPTAWAFSEGDLEAERLKVLRMARRFRKISVRLPPAQPSGGAS